MDRLPHEETLDAFTREAWALWLAWDRRMDDLQATHTDRLMVLGSMLCFACESEMRQWLRRYRNCVSPSPSRLMQESRDYMRLLAGHVDGCLPGVLRRRRAHAASHTGA